MAGILLLAVCGCAAGSLLTVKIGEPIYYRSEKGDRFVARYGQLSDGSLGFVKVKTPDGREHTLPSAMSASGARYTDDRELVWWEHHGTVRLDVRGADGQWETRYPELREELKGK
jgi:membrane-bound inhibitor of C-type lysozyme